MWQACETESGVRNADLLTFVGQDLSSNVYKRTMAGRDYLAGLIFSVVKNQLSDALSRSKGHGSPFHGQQTVFADSLSTVGFSDRN